MERVPKPSRTPEEARNLLRITGHVIWKIEHKDLSILIDPIKWAYLEGCFDRRPYNLEILSSLFVPLTIYAQ